MSVPKATEMTIRNFLMKELETRGVKVSTEVSYRTPIGRLMPDILLCNGAEYVVETKLGAEAKLLDAMVQLYDYSKYTSTNGGFAVLFPQELRRSWGIEIIEKIVSDPKLKYIATATFKDDRASQRFVGNLSEMADWIATHVLRHPSVEADTGFAIRVLTEAVEALTASVRALKETELEDIFGGKTVFENILQYEEGHYPVDEMKQAATYLLANQIIFYHVLSKMDLAFEDIDEDKIGKPNDLLNYFNPVLEKDYSSIFGFDVASRLPDSSTKIIKKVIMAVKALAPEKIGHDVLGKVFHELIPFNIRKSVAAFYTNNEAAEILAQLAIDDPDAKVMDLAVGSGTLLVAAYRRKRELKKKFGTYDLSKDHKKFLEEDLTGIDIMPFAAHLAVMHLSLQALLSETEKVRVAVWDSTELKLGMNIPAIHKELKEAYKRPTLDMFKEGGVTFQRDAFVKKGAITLEGLGGEEIPLKRADLVIMNPPFTREERMPQTYKNSLMKRFRDYADYLRRDLSFYSYFILLADKFLKEGGKIAFVMPATFLRVSANEGIRRFLLENYVIEHVVTTTERAAFSEQAQFREILLIARKGKGDGKEVTKFSILKKLPSTLKMGKDFARSIKKGEDTDNISNFTVTREELEKHISNWFEFIASDPLITNTWIKIRKKCEKSCNIFSKYLTNVNGQFKLGFQLSLGKDDMTELILMVRDRAIKSKDIWILDKITRKKVYFHHKFLKVNLTCPTSCTKPTLRRAAKVNSMDITDKLDRVIVKKWKGYSKFKEYNTKSSNFSRAQTEIIDRLGNLAIVYRMDISASGTCALAFYSEELFTPVKICWICKINQDHAKILTLWFNSTINIIQSLIRRVETRGAFLQLQKYALMNFLVLDPNLLSDREKTFLIDLFETIKDVPLPSVIDQLKNRSEFRLKIDKALLEILGFDEKEIAEFFDIVYPAVINQIEQLKTLMAG